MDSGVPLSPSFIATYPMMPTHFTRMNSFAFHNGMKNYGTQFTPWVSSYSPVDMPSPLQSSPWSTYMNPSLGSGGTMAPIPTSSFDMSHVLQPNFTMGGWNLPSYESSPSYASIYYTPSVYPSSAMSVRLRTLFP
jgi:hypothetical protein